MEVIEVFDKYATENRAIFLEYRKCNLHRRKYFLDMRVGSDSVSAGTEKGRGAVDSESDPTLNFKKHFPGGK